MTADSAKCRYRPGPGQGVALVAWENTKNGWRPALVHAIYRARTSTVWIVEIDGIETVLPRNVWEICVE